MPVFKPPKYKRDYGSQQVEPWEIEESVTQWIAKYKWWVLLVAVLFLAIIVGMRVPALLHQPTFGQGDRLVYLRISAEGAQRFGLQPETGDPEANIKLGLKNAGHYTDVKNLITGKVYRSCTEGDRWYPFVVDQQAVRDLQTACYADVKLACCSTR